VVAGSVRTSLNSSIKDVVITESEGVFVAIGVLTSFVQLWITPIEKQARQTKDRKKLFFIIKSFKKFKN
jgi:hypothetical protein